MQNDPTASGLREALAAVREALDIPQPATVGDGEVYERILAERTGHAVCMLRGILGEDPTIDVPWSAEYLRVQLARHPAEGYRTWDERMAELDAAKAAAS